MKLLLHQTVIFTFTTIYVPISLAYFIFMLKEKEWFNRLCYGIVGTVLLLNLPNILLQYQQYIMGHFAGLPETITTGQFTADIIFVIIFALVIGICACIFVAYTKRKRMRRVFT